MNPRAVFAACAAVALGACGLFHTVARPTAYGAELAACQEQAPPGPAGWEVYEPCCIDVAHRYGRDPSFCMRPEGDGGDQ